MCVRCELTVIEPFGQRRAVLYCLHSLTDLLTLYAMSHTNRLHYSLVSVVYFFLSDYVVVNFIGMCHRDGPILALQYSSSPFPEKQTGASEFCY